MHETWDIYSGMKKERRIRWGGFYRRWWRYATLGRMEHSRTRIVHVIMNIDRIVYWELDRVLHI